MLLHNNLTEITIERYIDMRFALSLLIEDANSFIIGSKTGFSPYANILLEIVCRYLILKTKYSYLHEECRLYKDLSLIELRQRFDDHNITFGIVKPRAVYLGKIFIDQLQ